jgi:hypothetical protein
MEDLKLVHGGILMLLALLYTDDQSLAACALACDEQPYGDRYWNEIHSHEVQAGTDTAYVDIEDDILARRLLSMDSSDGREAARAIDAYLFAPRTAAVPPA